MSERVYGHTKSGKPIDDTTIEEMADEAERGSGRASSGGGRGAAVAHHSVTPPRRSNRCVWIPTCETRRPSGPSTRA